MDKFDVFVWVDGDDGATASMATRSLRQRFKAEVTDWYMLGPKSERSERLAYDLGMKPLTRPETVAELGSLAATRGTSPYVLFWSGAAVLTAEWIPLQSGHVRIWETIPAAVIPRADLPGSGAGGWPELQAQTSLPRTLLPANQVKTVGPGDFEKAVHAQGWPFGHSVVILEPSTNRR